MKVQEQGSSKWRKVDKEYREAVHRAVDRQLDLRARRGVDVRLPAPEDLARFGVFAARTGSDLAELIGPVYDTRGVGELLRLERQQLDRRRRQGTILAMRTSDDKWVYPVFQFAGGQVSRRVHRLLEIFAEAGDGLDRWALAAWIAAPKSELDDRPPLEVGSDEEERVLELAAETAARWAA